MRKPIRGKWLLGVTSGLLFSAPSHAEPVNLQTSLAAVFNASDPVREAVAREEILREIRGADPLLLRKYILPDQIELITFHDVPTPGRREAGVIEVVARVRAPLAQVVLQLMGNLDFYRIEPSVNDVVPVGRDEEENRLQYLLVRSTREGSRKNLRLFPEVNLSFHNEAPLRLNAWGPYTQVLTNTPLLGSVDRYDDYTRAYRPGTEQEPVLLKMRSRVTAVRMPRAEKEETLLVFRAWGVSDDPKLGLFVRAFFVGDIIGPAFVRIFRSRVREFIRHLETHATKESPLVPTPWIVQDNLGSQSGN